MKRAVLSFFILSCMLNVTVMSSFSQSNRIIHEKPFIADGVLNIPQELIDAGKLSKYVVLSLPDDDRWNPDTLDLNVNGAVFAIEQSDSYNSCYIGGHFDLINGVPLKRIALFQNIDGGTFTDIGGGVEGGDVYTIIRSQNPGELYVGGNFSKAGNISAKGIAHWTGTEWEALGTGTDSTVLALAIVANDLYVGGNFHTAGGYLMNYIAKWDMVNKVWLPVIDGNTIGMNGGVAALALTSSGDLYVGGGFTKAGTVTANRIASFNSGKWSALGTGIEGANAFVSVISGTGHVGGDFHLAGGILANNIAYWDGSNWSNPGEFPSGFDGPVYALSTTNPMLFVGGNFHNSGLSKCNNIAAGNDLNPALGSGLDGPCYALAGRFLYISLQGDFHNHLFAGGNFTQAGLKPSQNFAIWGMPGGGSVKSNPSLASQVSLRISPDPAQSSSLVSFALPRRMNISLSIIDALGREVLVLGSRWYDAGAQELPLEVRNLSNGFYHCSLVAEGQSVSLPFAVIR